MTKCANSSSELLEKFGVVQQANGGAGGMLGGGHAKEPPVLPLADLHLPQALACPCLAHHAECDGTCVYAAALSHPA